MTIHPNLILHGGRVITCNESGDVAQAIALHGSHIAAVGTDQALLATRDANTRLIDLEGRAVIPGMTDGHAHMDREGLRRNLPGFAGARSIDDILDVIAREVRNTPPGTWIVTQPIGDAPEYADPAASLKEGRYPTRADLDRVSPLHPVYIRPIWGYWRNKPPLTSIANSLALKLAGIHAGTRSPSPAVTIERGDDGLPNGIFTENTLVPIVEHTLMRVAPGFSSAQREAGLRHAMAEYNRYGTTAVFEGHGVATEVAEAYDSVYEQGANSVRATLVFSPHWGFDGDGDAAELLRDWKIWLGRRGTGDEWLRTQGLYVEVDKDPLNNALRASNHPCTGWAGFQAGAAVPAYALDALLAEAARSQIRVSGIWPDLLPAFERANRVAPIGGQRWVLGHQPVLTADMVARIKDLGVVVTTHTNRHIYKDGDAWLQRRDPAQHADIVPLRTLRDAGIPVAFGSDNLPVSLFGPLWHATARLSRKGNPVAPEQAIGRQAALDIATRGGAYLTFDEHVRGSLEPGKLADLAMLSDDPLTCHADALTSIESLLTIVDGQIVRSQALSGASA
jgi:predicted amidohydrolase YtcJ